MVEAVGGGQGRDIDDLHAVLAGDLLYPRIIGAGQTETWFAAGDPARYSQGTVKLAPYIVIGGIDLIMCLLAAKYLFQVPMRGSLWIIIVSSLLYLIVSLGLGLLISATTRNQFAASQMALLASFMPAMMLSGFVFDLRNMPVIIQIISQALPATHFMGLIKTLFMAGDYWPDILKSCAILTIYTTVLIVLTRRLLIKNLD